MTNTSSAAAAKTATPRTKRIDEIQVGDLVASRNEQTGEVSLQLLRQAFCRDSGHLRILEIVADDGSTVQTIKTTDEHPFWVTDVGFKKAKELVIGAPIDQDNGRSATLLSTHREEHPGRETGTGPYMNEPLT